MDKNSAIKTSLWSGNFRYGIVLVPAFVLQGIIFLMLPLAHALFFDTPARERPTQEVVYELETLVKKKPQQTRQKTIRKIETPLNIQNEVSSQQRSLQMDLSLAAADAGDGVAVGGGSVSNVVYEPGEVDQEARVLQEVDPEFPRRAKREGISGYVKMYLVIDTQGIPTQVQVLKVEPAGYGFEKEALKALRGYRFSPAMLNDVPVRQKATKEFRFDIGF